MELLGTATLKLPVKLTEAELLTRCEQLAAILADLAARVAEEAEAWRAGKEAVEEMSAERDRLSQIVARRQEPRMVEVEYRADFTANRVYTVRPDTGEIVAERLATPEDRQLRIVE